MAKKKKKEKKEKPTKSPEERKVFVDDMKNKLLDMGCFPGQYPTASEFFKILDDYALDGTPSSGRLSFPECPFGGRDIYFILSNRKNIENAVHFMMKDRPKNS